MISAIIAQKNAGHQCPISTRFVKWYQFKEIYTFRKNKNSLENEFKLCKIQLLLNIMGHVSKLQLSLHIQFIQYLLQILNIILVTREA